MKRNMNKLNRYGKALGISVISGQKFREKPKKYKFSTGMSKLMEGDGQNGSRKDEH